MPHKCNRIRRVLNIGKVVEESDLKIKEQIVSSTLSSVQKSKIDNSSNKNGNDFIELSNIRGKATKVIINQKQNNTVISSDNMKTIQANFNLSQRQTLGIASNIRKATGNRNIIEKNLKRKLYDRIHSLDDFFEINYFDFESGKKNDIVTIRKGAVCCNDISGFIEFVSSKRGSMMFNCKFGIDGGGGFLKLCLSLQSPHQMHVESNNTPQRLAYKEGIVSKKFLDSGVKKLFILGLVPGCQETYKNINMLCSKINMLDIDNAVFAVDLKVANLLCGIGTHSSLYPCTWCFASKNKLDQKAELRTIQNITKYFSEWEKSGRDKNEAKNYMNCINIPVFKTSKEESESFIIDFIVPPELHLMLGVVNTIFNHMLKKFEKMSLKWADLCHVQRTIFRGTSGFDGNACKKLLANTALLRKICPLECLKFVQAFVDFELVVQACFSIQLKHDYVDRISKFKASYEDLAIPITPKVHAVLFHIQDFCMKKEVGLGYYSEQSMESVHYDFKKTWDNKYCIQSNNPNYMEHIKKTLCEFNSLHI